ncbi:MAG: MBL fold metallo-hydrolase [Synechococcaceae cyanobacterium]|nr:MBL fold metallo-hydrolase [Synechococcaceae cyanobacterium]
MRPLRALAVLLVSVALLVLAGGPDRLHARIPAAEPIRSQEVRGPLAMISGEGGNVGVLTGPQGTLLVDAKFARLADPVRAAVRGVGGSDPRLLINTHFHADHTDGNAAFAATGATIVAQRNVRRRLAEGSTIEAFNMVTPPATAAALPVVTFDRDLRLHLDGQTIDLLHLPAAHTDGDAIVVFRPANVIHAGDVWFNGMYPFIDAAHGGTLRGAIAGVDRLLALADAETRILPGHGRLGTRAELLAYRTMLATAQERLAALKARGLTAAQAVREKPLADLEERWGKGLFSGDRWIEVIWAAV